MEPVIRRLKPDQFDSAEAAEYELIQFDAWSAHAPAVVTTTTIA